MTFLIPRYGEICSIDSCFEMKVSGIGYPMFYGQVYYGTSGGLEFDFKMMLVNLIMYYIISCIILYAVEIFFQKR